MLHPLQLDAFIGGPQRNTKTSRQQTPQSGAQGAKGEYQLVMLRSFDPIVAKLHALPNDKLSDALQLP